MPTSSPLQAAPTSVPNTSHTPFPTGPLLPPSISTIFKIPSSPVVSAPYWVGSRLQEQKAFCGPDFQGISMAPFPRKVAAEPLTIDKISGPLCLLGRPSNPPAPAKRAVQGHAPHTPAYLKAPCFNRKFSFFSCYSSEIG